MRSASDRPVSSRVVAKTGHEFRKTLPRDGVSDFEEGCLGGQRPGRHGEKVAGLPNYLIEGRVVYADGSLIVQVNFW